MTRLLGVFLLGLALAGTTRADLVPPKGVRPIPVEHVIQIHKDYPEYSFFLVAGQNVAGVKIGAKSPLVIPAAPAARFRVYTLVAVPRESLKQYKTVAEFSRAVAQHKVPGMVSAVTPFGTFTDTRLNDPRVSITEGWRIEKISEKDGIIIKPAMPGKKFGESPEGEPPPDSATFAPTGARWIASLAATLAIVLGGLWLARRVGRHDE